MQAAAGKTLFRVVRWDPPDRLDFMPQGQSPGYQMPPDRTPALKQSILCGVSAFDDEPDTRIPRTADARPGTACDRVCASRHPVGDGDRRGPSPRSSGRCGTRLAGVLPDPWGLLEGDRCEHRVGCLGKRVEGRAVP